jgi:nitrogen-specific signal transduction histidine kinase/CheY-like chemotaxis protein
MALAAAAILAVLIRIWMAINDAARISEEHRELGIRMAQGQRLKSLGHLAGGIAHDFNNLLSVVRNYAHLMGSGQMPDAERQVAVGEIVAACEHGAGLTQQLLLFSRRDGTARTLVDPSTALTEMARLLSRTLGDGIRLVVDASASRAAIELAPGQLEQVLVNLAVNARDAMPDGGELLIALRDVRVGDSARVPAGDYVRLDVTDTGIGMTPDVTERIFEPFFSTKPRGRGTGLGLSTVYGIVHQAGGTVTVSSEPGIGTRFSLLFPAASVPARPAAPLSEPLPFPAGERIMLVEDDEAVRESTRQILEQSGYAVSAFADGEQAMAAWREQDGRFDLIVSDVVMPRVSGPELIARVRELRPDLPCLLVSGYPETQEDDSPVTALGVPLITKPFRADELLGAIDRVLAEQRVSEALQ